MSLFRSEVVEARRRRLWGEVRLAQPPSLMLWSIVLTIVGVIVVVCLVFGTYVRKETAIGYLTPDTGIIQIMSARPGRVVRLGAREGDAVTPGQIIVELTDDAAGTQTGQVGTAQMDQVQTQMRYELARQLADRQALDAEASGLRERLRAQQGALVLLEQRIRNQESAVQIAERQVTAYKSLVERGFGAQFRLDDLKKQQLAYSADLTNSRQEEGIVQGNVADLKTQLKAIAPRASRLSAITGTNIANLEQRNIELSSGSSFSLKSPVAGSISSAQTHRGQAVRGGEPLMAIMPTGATLQAELLLPTRAAGFVAVGDEVRLRVDAFPFQRFGYVIGQVTSVSRSVVTPADYLTPVEFQGAMYRVEVLLRSDHVMAYGRPQALLAGMSLTADIVTDRRPLWRQLFDPLLTARKRFE